MSIQFVISAQFQRLDLCWLWGCISVHGFCSLHSWKGTISAEKYIEVHQSQVGNGVDELFLKYDAQ